MRVIIAGIGGRMGGAVAREVAADPRFELAGGLERRGHQDYARLAGQFALPSESHLAETLSDIPGPARARPAVLVEFCLGPGAVRHAADAADQGIGVVSGSTALSAEEESILRSLATRVPVVRAPNFSWGAASLLHFAPDVRRAMGADYDVEIIETHHRGKRDVPSGTALALARAIAGAGGETEVNVGREAGENPRRAAEITVHAVRGGTVPGEHRILFAGTGETLELVHRVQGREAFAHGVLRAIQWCATSPPGWYGVDALFRSILRAEGGGSP